MLAMKHLTLALAVLAGTIVSAAVVSAAVKEPAEAKCPVSGKNCNPEKHADFDGGKVYFCCGNCQAAFGKDPVKFAAKAHHQMVSTGNLEQKACPFSGRPVNAGTEVEIEGVEVGFCCNNCKGKVEKASDADRITMVFGDISKGFAPAAK